MDSEGVSGEAMNVACGDRHSLLEIVDAIAEFQGKRPTVNHVEPRAGDVRHTQADIGKATKLMGYEPRVDFAEGMRKTLRYFTDRFGSRPSAAGRSA
jgi:UDP-glucose 4-epimerase